MADYSQLMSLEKQKKKEVPIVHQTSSSQLNQEATTNTPLPLQNQPQKTNERTNEQRNKKPDERKIERHSFDIFSDQKMGLDELQFMLYRKNGKKPKIGSLVREAIDDLFKKYKNERKNE